MWTSPAGWAYPKNRPGSVRFTCCAGTNTIAHTRQDGDGVFPTNAQISVLHQQASSVTIPVIYVRQIKMSIHIASECWVSDLKRLRKFGELRCRTEITHSGQSVTDRLEYDAGYMQRKIY
jgi:hypothetical protein